MAEDIEIQQVSTAIQAARDAELGEYKEMLKSVNFDGHPGAQYLTTGFAEGFGRGFMAGSGAAMAGISTVIGNIDNGMYDLEEAKDSLIALRNAIRGNIS